MSRLANHHVATRAAEERVVTVSAAQPILAAASLDPVVLRLAKEPVGAPAAIECVRSPTAKEKIGGAGAENHFCVVVAFDLVAPGVTEGVTEEDRGRPRRARRFDRNTNDGCRLRAARVFDDIVEGDDVPGLERSLPIAEIDSAGREETDFAAT